MTSKAAIFGRRFKPRIRRELCIKWIFSARTAEPSSRWPWVVCRAGIAKSVITVLLPSNLKGMVDGKPSVQLKASRKIFGRCFVRPCEGQGTPFESILTPIESLKLLQEKKVMHE